MQLNGDHRRWWAIAIAVAVAAVLVPAYWIALHAPAAGMFHDDGVYLVTAKALATGHGYRIISLPDEIPQTKYPILFPFVLSLVWRLAPDFPSNVIFLKLVPLCFGFIWFCLSFRLIAREASRGVAAICVALTAALLWSVYLSTTLLSETMFAALCMGSLLYLRRAESPAQEGREWTIAAVLAGLCCLTRTAGVCAVATGVFYFLAQRRAGRALKFLGVALVVCGPWFVWVTMQHLPETDAYYSAVNYGSWNVLSHFFSFDKKIVIVTLNALMLLRSPWEITGIRWNGWLELLTSIVFLAAGFRWLRRWTAADIFLAIYLAMTLAWAWPPNRFVVVVYPLILLLGWRIWQSAAERFRWSAVTRLVAGITILGAVGLQCAWSLVDSTRAVLTTGVVLRGGDEWRDTWRQMRWIRDNTPQEAVVMANLDPMFYLYSGRKAVRGFQDDPYGVFYRPAPGGEPLGTLADLKTTLRNNRVSYIVRAPNGAFGQAVYLDRLILQLVASEHGAVRLVDQGQDNRFQIYRVEGAL